MTTAKKKKKASSEKKTSSVRKTAVKNNTGNTKKTVPAKKKKPKRHLNPAAVALFAAIILAVYAVFAIPRYITNSKLKNLGYDKETITSIREQKLSKTLISEGYYSDYLASAIRKGTLNTDYIELYTVVSADNPLDEEDFLLYSRLADAGYEEDQLLNLFSQLDRTEMLPLLVLDWQWDETGYIDDCLEHRSENSSEQFILSGSYRKKYKFTSETENPSSVDALVNFNYMLDENYAPDDLENLSSQIAVNGMSLRSEAADACSDLITAAVNDGVPFFVSVSYNSWSDQDYAYSLQLVRMSEEQADEVCIRAGYSEHQTGYAINVVPTYESGDFEETQVYQWLQENAAEYGFIQRYPSGKTSITGMDEEENHYRYLGKELAQKVKDSGLTYDEYYCLYLKSWDHEEYIPSESVIAATGAASHKAGTAVTEEKEESETEEGSAVQEEETSSGSSN